MDCLRRCRLTDRTQCLVYMDTTALIKAPASVARSAPGAGRRVEIYPIYAWMYARKPLDKVRLDA